MLSRVLGYWKAGWKGRQCLYSLHKATPLVGTGKINGVLSRERIPVANNSINKIKRKRGKYHVIMDSVHEGVSSLKRKSTLELSFNDVQGVGRKSSRVHAVASVRAATSKLAGSSRTSTGVGVQKTLSKSPGGFPTHSLAKATSKTSLSKSASTMSLTKSVSKTSLTKSASKTSLTKSASKSSWTKSTSKSSLTKSASKTSLTKSASKTSLTKSARKSSLTKSASKTSLTKSASKTSLTKSASKTSLTKSLSNTSKTNAVSLKSRLTSKASDAGGKKLWFSNRCHVAVRADNGPKFYLCRLQQNVFNSTKEVKVRWLSVAGVRFHPNIYRMSYLDKIDPASILMHVGLTQKSRVRYLLPSDQEAEIDNMIQLVEDVQSGKISIQDVGEDVQEVVQIDEPPKKKPKLVKSASQRVRDKVSKAGSKKSSSSPRAKKTNKQEPKEKKDKKEPKRKVARKEDELKLNPRPDFKILDKDPLYETRESMPYVSKVSNSKLVFRAINLGDAAMLKKLLKDGRRIKNLHNTSVLYGLGPFEVLAKNLNKDVMAVLMEEFVGNKFKKRFENNPDDVTNLDRMGTGQYNQRSLAVSRIRAIQASRGSKEGNNAFLNRERECQRSIDSWSTIADDLLEQGMPPSTVDELQEHFKNLKSPEYTSLRNSYRRYTHRLINDLLSGHHKRAGHDMKNFIHGKHFASETLMANVLLFDDEDLTQCPPSAVKEICKRIDKITAIHCAAANPNSKYLTKLLSVIPNAQVPDAKGRRPIHYAAGCSSPDNLKLLLSWRANTQDTCTDMKIPLHYAVLARRVDNVAVLLKHDKSSHSSDPNVIRYGIGGVNRPMRNSLLPLHEAARMGEVGIARILLANGAMVNATTSIGSFKLTPLQMAAGTGNLEMVKLLVDHGAIVEQKDRLGRTALLMACMNGATKVLSYLLHLGANPQRADSSENTPLHYAAAYGWYFTVRMLMDVGADPNATNMWKISPLFVAYMKGHVGIVRQLLGYSSISINQVLNDGSTLLFHACESDLTHDDLYEQIEYMIKDKGALCDIKDVNGMTALFYLATASMGDIDKLVEGQQQSIKIAQLLLDNGCDIHAVDDWGFTALMQTLGYVRNTSLAEFLMKKGCQVFAPADGERKETVLHLIVHNVRVTKTGIVKVMEIMKQPKHIEAFRAMAKCYDDAGYTPLLDLCSKNLFLDLGYEEKPSDNRQHFIDFFRFLMETLHSSVNAVVTKKCLAPDDILPPEGSKDWYSTPDNAERTALMLLLSEVCNDDTMGSETENGVLTMIQYLIEHGADLNTVDRNGQTPLYLCVKQYDIKLLNVLGEKESCDVDFEIKESKDGPHKHLLHCSNRMDEMKTLLDIGCNPNVLTKDKKYTSFLHKMVLQESFTPNRDEILQIVEQLLENESNGGKRFNFNIQDWRGRTVLHQLARQNPGTLSTSLELEFKVIQSGGKVGLQDNKGKTALHYVFKPKKQRGWYRKSGRDALVDATQLTQMVAKCMSAEEINARDYSGMTALHMAAQMGASVSCVMLLSMEDTKADISLYDKDGNTALTLAVLNKRDACAVSLIQSGACLTDDVIVLSDQEKGIRQSARKAAYYKGEEWEEQGEDDDSAYWSLHEAAHLKRSVKVTKIPLYKAAMKNGLQGVAMLVSQADPSKSGCTPVEIIKMAFEEHHYNIALETLYRQWNSGLLRKLDEEGRNLLHLLAISCQGQEVEDPLICKVAKFLIKEKMPMEQKDKSGLYPIHWAVINHQFDLADLLAEHSTTYEKDPNGRHFSYLEAALWRIYSDNGITTGVWEYLDKLGDKGLDFNRHIKLPLYPDLFCNYLKGSKKDPQIFERTTATATTALIVSIRTTAIEDNKTHNFLVSGASPNLADGQQLTPMMHAVMKNDIEHVSQLLNYEYPDCMKENPAEKPTVSKRKRPNTSIFRLKPQDEDSESEISDDDSLTETVEVKKKDENEWKPVPKTSDVDLDAKDKNGRTALHYVACPEPGGTYDNAKMAFLLVKAGAKELKDKAGMTPYALAIKMGALDVAATLKSLGHGKKDSSQTQFNRHFPVVDGITFKPSLRSKPDFRQDAISFSGEDMEQDRSYEHTIDTNCNVQNGILLKDEAADIWYDVLLTKVDVKRCYHAAYNFYKIQLVQQSSPSLYILFTSWGCIGMPGQFQHTPFSDLAAATKEFCKIFREKTGNKWENIKSFEIKPRKYRLLDDSARLAPPKMSTVDMDLKSTAQSALPAHLLDIMTKIMNPKDLINAMERLNTLSMESLPFGKLSQERLREGLRLLREIKELVKEKDEILVLDEDKRKEKEPRHTEICQKIAEISNDYFHTIPQKDFVYESICPLDKSSTVVRHLQAVDNLLDYEIACQMLKGAIKSKAAIHPCDYVYRCLDCKLELMQPSDAMSQYILKYIYATGNSNNKVTGIYKVDREGEAARLDKTGLENRRLLFHGTRASNLLSILSRGLVTIFPEHGSSYGHGIYFSDSFNKSRCYTDNFGIMLLCEVALGKPYILNRYESLPNDQTLDEIIAKNGCHSLAANSDENTWKNWFKLPSGVSLHISPSSDTPEYVVMNPAQVCIRYLVKLEHVA